MDDVLPLIGGGAVYGILSAALILFWRMFVWVAKDRDFYRAETFRLLQLTSAATTVAQTAVRADVSKKEQRAVLKTAIDAVIGTDVEEMAK